METETVKTAFGNLVRVVEGIRQNGNAKVLVVGAKGDNFPAEYRAHKQLIFWDSDESSGRDVPQAVKLILLTRFIRHHVYHALSDIAVKRNIIFGVKTMGTGEIKTVLRPLVYRGALPEPDEERVREKFTQPAEGITVVSEPVVAKTAEEPMETETVVGRKSTKGALKAFVLEHADLHKRPISKEGERVAELALQAGFTKTTAKSVTQTIYQIRSDNGHASRTVTVKPAAKPAPTRKAPATRTVKASPFAVADDSEVTRLLDDAMAALDLVKQELAKRAERRAELAQRLAGLL